MGDTRTDYLLMISLCSSGSFCDSAFRIILARLRLRFQGLLPAVGASSLWLSLSAVPVAGFCESGLFFVAAAIERAALVAGSSVQADFDVVGKFRQVFAEFLQLDSMSSARM